MFLNLRRRRPMLAWQMLFVLLGTTWLWAPLINHTLSSRLSFISHYEAVPQPYGWLFRMCDALAALLLLYIAWLLITTQNKRVIGIMLAIIAGGMALDVVAPTTCHVVGNLCKETPSLVFWVHAIESTLTGTALAVLTTYDIKKRKQLISMLFLVIQLTYVVLFITKLAEQTGYVTLAQFIYESSVIIWLAWFCRDMIQPVFAPKESEASIVKTVAAIWAAVNGVLAILISLAHIHLLGRISGLYFASDSAWLAQHGVIIGVIMLYLSRHLARGEMRARQIFLAITGIETIKYALISPHPLLLVIYSVTFVLLFVFRDDFDRGTLPLTWSGRLKDLMFMAGGLTLSALLALILLDRDNRVALITGRAFANFSHYAIGGHSVAGMHLRSVLLAHTISAFLIASTASVLWILFKPYKHADESTTDYKRVRHALTTHSSSSEDFFKVWPTDKSYFWSSSDGFIAYKVVGPVAFVLADPISPNHKLVLDEFVSWCKARRLTTCILPIYQQSTDLYKDAGFSLIQIGSSAVIPIQRFLNETVNGKWWRWQKNRATKAGYEYRHASPPYTKAFIQELQTVSDAWLRTGGHTERGFSLGYFDAYYLQQCDIHYLVDTTGSIVAFTNQLPLFRAGKTATIDLLRYDPAHSNSMPYLLYRTMDWLQENTEQDLFDLGFVPFAGARGPVLQIAKAIASGRFSARGLEQFKNKFEPDWQPNYLAHNGDVVDLALIGLNLERAMSLETKE